LLPNVFAGPGCPKIDGECGAYMPRIAGFREGPQEKGKGTGEKKLNSAVDANLSRVKSICVNVNRRQNRALPYSLTICDENELI